MTWYSLPDLFDIGEYLVDVARVDIDGPEDKHIIGPTQYPVVPRHYAPQGHSPGMISLSPLSGSE